VNISANVDDGLRWESNIDQNGLISIKRFNLGQNDVQRPSAQYAVLKIKALQIFDKLRRHWRVRMRQLGFILGLDIGREIIIKVDERRKLGLFGSQLSPNIHFAVEGDVTQYRVRALFGRMEV